ncbi:MAG: amidase, partial [Candidatus Sedimenticola sp. 4PFRAG1]
MYSKSIAQLSAGLKAGEFSSVELTRSYLDRIKSHNGELNAYITVCEASALAAAEAADVRIRAGDATVMTGIPIAHKDIFCTNGIKTTCGSRMLDNFIAPYDATVVSRLQDAGAVVLGKTNMDEFAMGSSNETSFFGSV